MRANILWSLWLVGCGLPELPEVAQPCGKWPEPGTYSYAVDVDGKKRKAQVYVPPTEGPRDIVVALHGGASNADAIQSVTRFDHIALRDNFVTVYPQGRKSLLFRVWNAGDCCGNIDEEHRDAKDVEFLDKLVSELTPRVCGDRVLAVGFSNGGMMANRWGCEGRTPDAVVSAAGPLLRNQCAGSPRPFRHYHGLADQNVPYSGGQGKGTNVWPAASRGFGMWQARNGCSEADPETFRFGSMTCQRFDCAASTELCTIEGWAHAWPGGRNANRMGGQSDATQDVITFLRATIPSNYDEPEGGTTDTGGGD